MATKNPTALIIEIDARALSFDRVREARDVWNDNIHAMLEAEYKFRKLGQSNYADAMHENALTMQRQGKRHCRKLFLEEAALCVVTVAPAANETAASYVPEIQAMRAVNV